MRIVGLRLRVDSNGVNGLIPDETVERLLEDEREALSDYLAQAPVAVRVAGREPDPLSADSFPRVPMNTYTDGEWVWQGELLYYVRNYGFAPDSPEFLEYCRARRFKLVDGVTDAQLHEARRLVGFDAHSRHTVL
jgi:hypothetical protein